MFLMLQPHAETLTPAGGLAVSLGRLSHLALGP